MMKVESILCPVDLTHDSAKALSYAAALARLYGARLLVFHSAGERAGGGRGGALEEVKRVVWRALGACEAGAQQVALEIVVGRGGDAAEAITREAAERGVSLIVMCSRRRPLRAALLGSTAESVYRTAPCPVLIMHPDEREREATTEGLVALRRVLVAHDFSDCSEVALKLALSLAEERGAELHLLHVLPPPVNEPELAWSQATVEGSYHKAAHALRQAVGGEPHAGLEVKTAVRWGKPYREALVYAAEHDVDLVCMGAHGAGFGMQALVGSNTDRVLRQSPCPVLVARPLKPLIRTTPVTHRRTPACEIR